jgi:hypothetical protein
MDFIEKIFGWSPDDGSGAFELMLFAIPLIGIAYPLMRRRSRRDNKQ